MRRETISRTHADTYEWIFNPDEDRGRTAHLHEWLRTGSGVFWVSGKPGSGKSTLMKFIHGHPRTTELLQERIGESKLVVSGFFFWINGGKMQRSQAGLLREMCADVARQCPSIIFDVWKSMTCIPADCWSEGRYTLDWPISTLRLMLDAVQGPRLRHHGHAVSFAFFIDGLDEHGGDQDEVIDIIKRLAAFDNVKVCASSRPWNIFERAFGQEEQQKLYMQRLTHEDISKYAQDNIGEDEHFKKLLQEDHAAQEIIDTIISRSEGVFLWAHLVTKRVQRSLVNRDGMDALKRRIDQMPSDLNAYFQHMFDSLVCLPTSALELKKLSWMNGDRSPSLLSTTQQTREAGHAIREWDVSAADESTRTNSIAQIPLIFFAFASTPAAIYRY